MSAQCSEQMRHLITHQAPGACRGIEVTNSPNVCWPRSPLQCYQWGRGAGGRRGGGSSDSILQWPPPLLGGLPTKGAGLRG